MLIGCTILTCYFQYSVASWWLFDTLDKFYCRSILMQLIYIKRTSVGRQLGTLIDIYSAFDEN